MIFNKNFIVILHQKISIEKRSEVQMSVGVAVWLLKVYPFNPTIITVNKNLHSVVDGSFSDFAAVAGTATAAVAGCVVAASVAAAVAVAAAAAVPAAAVAAAVAAVAAGSPSGPAAGKRKLRNRGSLSASVFWRRAFL